MALYTSQSRDRVRDAVDFVELVSARTDLRRAGPSRYEGLCPFHDERTPSFGIDPVQKVYYCFGCQAAGDVFTFVQETEGLDFKGALELLAERAGVELEREQEDPREAERRQRRERLLELLGRTVAFYERVLWDSTEAAGAREYLASRGLGEEILRTFQVGYAPSAWSRVLSASLRAGFREGELLAAGVAQRSRENGRAYDRFRRRIMFPLADLRGRVLGFGARALGDDQGPKYLNSTDNEVYHKGEHLYGAHLARPHAAKAGAVLLCEGYTDVIALHQAGMREAVGLMGTALTEQQLSELSRMASTVLLALDADTAGQEAMLKTARLAARRKLELRVVSMPGGMDPADLIQREGAEAMRAAIEASVPFVRFQVERILASGDPGSPEGRDRIAERLRPVFGMLPASALRLDLARLAASRLSLSESLLEDLLSARPPQRRPERSDRDSGDERPAFGETAPTGGRASERGPLARRRQAERAFLAMCLASPEAGAQALARLRPEDHLTEGVLRRATEHLRAGSLTDPLAGMSEGDTELARVLAELVVEAGAEEGSEAMLRVCEVQLELAHVDRLIQAARSGGGGEVIELARRREAVRADLDRAQEHAMEQGGS